MDDSHSKRKPDTLRRRYLRPRHRGVARPYNPSVGPEPGRGWRVPGPRARRVGRSFLRGLPWLGLACWLAVMVTRPAGLEGWRTLLMGLGTGALATPLLRRWALVGERRADPGYAAAASGVGATTGIGLGCVPGLWLIGGWACIGLAGIGGLLGIGGIGLSVGWRSSAWIWRAASAGALLLATALVVQVALQWTGEALLANAGRVGAAGALALVAWFPTALLAIALEHDPSVEPGRE